MVELQEQSLNHQKEVEKEHRIREAAYKTNTSTSEVRATQTQSEPPQTFDISTDDPMETTADVIGDVQADTAAAEQKTKHNIIILVEHHMGESTTQGHQMAHQMAQAKSAPMPPQQSSSSSSAPVVYAPVGTQPQQQIMGEAETKSRRGRPPRVKQTIGDKPTREKSIPKKQLPQIPTRQTPPPIPEVTLDAIMEDTKPQSVPPPKARSKPNIPAVADEPMPESKKRDPEPSPDSQSKAKAKPSPPEPKQKAKSKPSQPEHASSSTELAIVDEPPDDKKKEQRPTSEPPPETERPPQTYPQVLPSKSINSSIAPSTKNSKNRNMLSVDVLSA